MAETVSIVMANYNKEKYIGEAIESILNQQYKDIELIIIDDGSTDNSPGIIKKYAGLDSRIKYELLEHKGKIHAFNRGMERAGGRYLTIRSSDDILFSNAISILIEEINGHDLVGHNLIITDENLNIIKRRFIMMSRYSDQIHLADVINGLSFPSGSYLFSRKAVDKIFPIPETVPYEDWYIFMIIVNEKMKTKYLNEDLAFYRQLNESAYGGVYNYNDKIIKYRAKRELLMLDVFEDMLPEEYLFYLFKARVDLNLIIEGKVMKALFNSRFSIKRRPAKLLLKKLMSPFLKGCLSLRQAIFN